MQRLFLCEELMRRYALSTRIRQCITVPAEVKNMSGDHPTVSIYRVGLLGKCPHCGNGPLFEGFLKLAPRCTACGLDYSFAEPADGPAFFVMLFFSIPATAFTIWIEMAHNPPLWMHFITSLPFLLLLCIPPLRPIKGLLVASQYQNKAEEGKLTIRDEKRP